MPCKGCIKSKDNVQFVAAQGPVGSPLTIVATPNCYDLEEGRLFSDGRGVTLANALSEARFKFEQAYIVPIVHQWPAAEDGTYTPLQLEQCAEEFKRELHLSQSRVILLLGGDSLAHFIGSGGPKGGLKRWRGYILTPRECLLGSCAGAPADTLIATYDPAFVQSTGFKTFAWFSKDILQAVSASRGRAPEIFGVPEQGTGLPADGDVRAVGIDIETNGFLGETEQIGYGWRAPAAPKR